jgi:hypothetical protein
MLPAKRRQRRSDEDASQSDQFVEPSSRSQLTLQGEQSCNEKGCSRNARPEEES